MITGLRARSARPRTVKKCRVCRWPSPQQECRDTSIWAAGGAITAAQFQRFIKDTPRAHLDVAGTAMDSAKNQSGLGVGLGVRLLDRLVADSHEKAEK